MANNEKTAELERQCEEMARIITDLMNRAGVTYQHPRVKGKVDLLIEMFLRKAGEDYALQFEVVKSPDSDERTAIIRLIDLMNESPEDYAQKETNEEQKDF